MPIPAIDNDKFPEVRALTEKGVNTMQHHWRLDGSQMGTIFQGTSPTNDGTILTTTNEPPQGFVIPDLPERPEEFAPGLTPELKELVLQAANMKL